MISKFLKSLGEQTWFKWLVGGAKVTVIFSIIIALVFSVGYFIGKGNRPVQMSYKDFEAKVTETDGSTHKIAVKSGLLYFDGKLIRTNEVDKLKEFGIVIRPKIFFGIGSAFEPEIGAGFQLLKYKKFNLDFFGTQKALYLGVSYDLDFPGAAGTLIQNSSIGVAAGKTWNSMFGKDTEDEWRALVYWSIKF